MSRQGRSAMPIRLCYTLAALFCSRRRRPSDAARFLWHRRHTTRKQLEFPEESVRGGPLVLIGMSGIPRTDECRIVNNGVPHSWVTDASVVLPEVLDQVADILRKRASCDRHKHVQLCLSDDGPEIWRDRGH